MTPAWRLFTTVYPATIELLARSGEIDVVVPVLLQRSASQEVAAAVRDAVARLRDDGVPVPVYVCWVAPRAADPHAALLQEAGVPCFAWPERTGPGGGRGGPLRPAPSARAAGVRRTGRPARGRQVPPRRPGVRRHRAPPRRGLLDPAAAPGPAGGRRACR